MCLPGNSLCVEKGVYCFWLICGLPWRGMQQIRRNHAPEAVFPRRQERGPNCCFWCQFPYLLSIRNTPRPPSPTGNILQVRHDWTLSCNLRLTLKSFPKQILNRIGWDSRCEPFGDLPSILVLKWTSVSLNDWREGGGEEKWKGREGAGQQTSLGMLTVGNSLPSLQHGSYQCSSFSVPSMPALSAAMNTVSWRYCPF